MSVLDEAERAALRDADERLLGLQDALEAAARTNALDAEACERLDRTAHEAARRLNEHLPVHFDPVLAEEIRKRVIDLLTTRADGDRPLDVADRVLVQAEAIRHIVRDLLDEQPPMRGRTSREVIGQLEEWLAGLPVGDLAKLLGLGTRQLQRRRQDDGTSTSRMHLVLRLVAILRHGWTDRGVYEWFVRERTQLNDKAPIELLDEPGAERALMGLARAGRVQGGV